MADPHAGVVATLGGVPLLATTTVSWALTPGTSPRMEQYLIAATDAGNFARKAMKPFAKPADAAVELVVKLPGSTTPLVVKGLYALRVIAGPDPWTRYIQVADRRWLWARKHIVRRYNVRRRTGDKRITYRDQLANVASVDDISYAGYSLDSGAPWKARAVLLDILEALEPSEPDPKAPGVMVAQYTVPDELRDQLPIDSLELDDSGDQALGRALAFLPGLDVTVDADGTVRVYDALDVKNSQREIDRGPAIVGTGQIVTLDNQALRPYAVRCWFTREVECRLDAVEGLADIGGINILDNVLPIPDTTLPVNGKTLAQGTWITIEDALTAWNALGDRPAGIPPLTLRLIQEGWFQGIFAAYAQFGGPVGYPIWAARIAAIRHHYRQTYRIDREWLDRILDMRDRGISIIDEETGGRAPVVVYTDYCVIPSERGLILQGGNALLGLDVKGYAQRLGGLLPGLAVPPVALSIMDRELGILRLDYRVDSQMQWNTIVPGKVLNIPAADPLARVGPRWWQEAHPQRGLPMLSPDHGVAIILPLVPASPNSVRQLQHVTVMPQEAQDTLRTVGVSVDLSRSIGPLMDVRIGPGVTTARFAWLDTAAAAAERKQVFGIGGQDPPLTPVGWMNEEECGAVAKAVAAVAYAGLIDYEQGGKAYDLQPAARIGGLIDSVVHQLDTQGNATTAISIPASPVKQRSYWSLMPDWVRRRLMRLVQP